MPFVFITTSVPVEKLPPDFNKLATKKFAELTGQPEAYMAIITNAGAKLTMGGSDEPSVVLLVKAGNAFSPEKNGELFRKAADFFHETLGIKLCRTYSHFEEYSPPFVGVCGETLEKALEMMAKGECGDTCICGEKHW